MSRKSVAVGYLLVGLFAITVFLMPRNALASKGMLFTANVGLLLIFVFCLAVAIVVWDSEK
jgi:hypothetical protein